MINFQTLQTGDYVMAEYAGKLQEGIITQLNNEDKQVCVETEVQEFWYDTDQLYPIPLNDEQLMKFRFSREDQEDGTVKYKKGSFRLVIPAPDDFSQINMWWREDRRQPVMHYVHELQNHYLQMTKVHLTREIMV